MIHCDLFDAEHEYVALPNGTWDLFVQVTKMHTELPVYFEVLDKNVMLDETSDESPFRFCEGYLSRGGGAVALAMGQDVAAMSGLKPPPPLLSEGATIVVRDVPKRYQSVALATRVAMIMRDCCKVDKMAVLREEQKQEMALLSERIEELIASLDALERARDSAERLLLDGRVAYRVAFPESNLFQGVLLSALARHEVSIVRFIEEEPGGGFSAVILAPSRPTVRAALGKLFLKVEKL